MSTLEEMLEAIGRNTAVLDGYWSFDRSVVGHHLSDRNLPAPKIPVRDYPGSVPPGLGDFPVGESPS